MLKYALATTTFAALMLSSALGQSVPPVAAQPMPPLSKAMPSSIGSDTFLLRQNTGELPASQLLGASVMGPDNIKIGEIDDVLIESNGAVRAIVIAVGGFLGVGQKDVAIPLKSLVVKTSVTGGKIETLSVLYTKEQLKGAPVFRWAEVAPETTKGKRSDIQPGK